MSGNTGWGDAASTHPVRNDPCWWSLRLQWEGLAGCSLDSCRCCTWRWGWRAYWSLSAECSMNCKCSARPETEGGDKTEREEELPSYCHWTKENRTWSNWGSFQVQQLQHCEMFPTYKNPTLGLFFRVKEAIFLSIIRANHLHSSDHIMGWVAGLPAGALVETALPV